MLNPDCLLRDQGEEWSEALHLLLDYVNQRQWLSVYSVGGLDSSVRAESARSEIRLLGFAY